MSWCMSKLVRKLQHPSSEWHDVRAEWAGRDGNEDFEGEYEGRSESRDSRLRSFNLHHQICTTILSRKEMTKQQKE